MVLQGGFELKMMTSLLETLVVPVELLCCLAGQNEEKVALSMISALKSGCQLRIAVDNFCIFIGCVWEFPWVTRYMETSNAFRI
jgi:hypothetical protein